MNRNRKETRAVIRQNYTAASWYAAMHAYRFGRRVLAQATTTRQPVDFTFGEVRR